MRKIRNAFEDRKSFIAYLTAGDPDIETTRQLIVAMEQAGVNLVEIGIPCANLSIGIEDVIESNRRALEAETTVDDVFNMISGLDKTVRIPMILVVYLDTIKDYGISRFMRKCKECNINGIVVPDLAYEDRTVISRDCDLFGVTLISVVTPSSRDRIAAISKQAKGFVYCESGKYVVEDQVQIDFREIVATVRANASVPCALGFGITTPYQAKEMAQIADGVVIGTGIIRVTAQYGKDCIRPVTDYVRTIKTALNQA